MLIQEYHVAYYIGANLLSGVNVIAHDEIEAMAKAYELKRLENWRVCYVHAKHTNVLSMIEHDPEFYFNLSGDVKIRDTFAPKISFE